MTPAQCRATRAILKLEVRDLADAANLSTSTNDRLERGEDLPGAHHQRRPRALETKGVDLQRMAG